MTKSQLRPVLLSQLYSTAAEVFTSASSRAWALLLNSRLWEEADAVLAYSPLQAEIDSTMLLNKAIVAQKALFLPRIDNKDMTFHQMDNLELTEKHTLGFSQPGEERPIFCLENFTHPILIAPALAAHHQGYRLGRGGGFYDRYLAKSSPALTTIVTVLEDYIFDFPLDPFDIPFQYILTGTSLHQVN